MTTLTDQLYGSLPACTYCFPALLRIVDIIETTDVPTAAVECLPQPRMFVNPDFVSKHANTSGKLTFLLLHELHHVILGHTRLYPRAGRIENLAFDIVINALLARSLPHPRDHALLTDFYNADELPAALLRPVVGWVAPSPSPSPLIESRFAQTSMGVNFLHVPKIPVIPWANRAPRRLVKAYKDLYWGDGCTYSELIDALRQLIRQDDQSLAAIPLLGDHSPEDEGASSSGNLESRSETLFDAVRKIVADWPPPPIPSAGQSWGDILKPQTCLPVQTPRGQLRRAIQAIARKGTGAVGTSPRDTAVHIETAIPRLTRRGVVARAIGRTPFLNPDVIDIKRGRLTHEPVHVYLDVSGSVDGLIGALFGAVVDAGSAVHPVIHQFSTEVSDVTLAELRRGVCRTTGGTSIECVANHMIRHKVKRALIVTDGYVGTPGATGDAWMKSSRIAVAVTPGASLRRDLEPYTDVWTELSLPGAA
jgi:hypothetical protein